MLTTTLTELTLAQVRLNLYSAYVFDDHFEAYSDSYTYYYGKIKGGYQWGAGLEFALRPTYSVELIYQRQDTKAPITWQAGQSSFINQTDLDFNANYILLGGNRYLVKADGKVEVYGTLMAGMSIVDINNYKTNESDNVTKFAWGAKLGCNVWGTGKVGLKIQAQLLSMVQGAGGGIYFGTGGAGVGVGTYSTIYQFSLGGGLTFRLEKRKS